MAGRLGEGSYHELRVHGVAGTPPEGMLDDLEPTWPPADDCGNPTGQAQLTVWRRQRTRPGRRAYSWSSVTSGSARSALYLLLVPHLLLNLAGWAALPSGADGTVSPGTTERGRSVRIVTTGVRLLALGLTVIMAQWALLACVDLIGYQWAVRIHGWPAGLLGLGVLATGLAVEGVLAVTRLRMRRDVAARAESQDLTDPVGYASLAVDQHLMWNSPLTIAFQRRAHHAVGLGSIAVVAVAMVSGWVPMPQPWAGLGTVLGWVAMLGGTAAMVQHSMSTGTAGHAGADWLPRAAREVGRIGVLAAAAAAAGATASGRVATAVTPDMVDTLDTGALDVMADSGGPVFLPVIRDLGLAVTVGFTLACLVVGALAWLLRHRPPAPADRTATGHPLQAFGLPGLALLAGAVGGGMGAAAAAGLSRVLGDADAVVVPGPLPEALAIAFAALAVLLGWVLVVGLALHIHPPAGTWRVTLTTAVQRLLRRGSWLLATLTGLGVLGVGVITLLVRTPDNPLHVLIGAQPLPQLIVLIAAGMVASAIGLAVAIVRRHRGTGLAVAAVLLVAATIAVIQIPSDELARQLRPAAMAIGLLTPAGFVAGKGISALRSASDRRTIAILWEVGTFLPRWFDPLSPPTYSDAVVTDLQDLIAEEVAAPIGEDGRQPTLLLAPHSQGTVLCAAAVLGLPAPIQTDRLALLTYGSPLRHLYAEIFPRLFDADVFAQLHGRLGGRWRNLLRTSDPIAAPVGISGVDVVMTEDRCGRGHSAYPREHDYRKAVKDLQTALGTDIHIPEATASPSAAPTASPTPTSPTTAPDLSPGT